MKRPSNAAGTVTPNCNVRGLLFAVARVLRLFALAAMLVATASADEHSAVGSDHYTATRVELGPRPAYLVDQLPEGALKRELSACAAERRRFDVSDFSIGHRGAPLQFPEHTAESYVAAARMGAGIIECDVTFTKDKELVCRHSQCDLHTTTNILATPLAERCRSPFTPAEVDPKTGALTRPATAECCTSDLTLAEFKSLRGKMDAADPRARTVAQYLGGTPRWRTDLYAANGTLVSHRESIALIKSLGRKFTPELKEPAVAMPFDGFSQQDYAAKLIAEYHDAGVPASDVWPQSFNYDDVLFWVGQYEDFGRQAVYLIGDNADAGPLTGPPEALSSHPPPVDVFRAVKDAGVTTIAPPIPALLRTDEQGRIAASDYGFAAGLARRKPVWTLLHGPQKGRVHWPPAAAATTTVRSRQCWSATVTC